MKFSSRKTVVAALAALAVLSVSACNAAATADNTKPSTNGTQTASASETPSPTPTIDPVAWKSNVTEDATGVAVDTRVTAAADQGDLTKASLSYVSKKGNTVAVSGKLDGGSWTAGDLLEPGVKYSLALEAKNSSGEVEKSTRTFRTANLTLDDQIYVAVSPGDGADVGIGMPVIVRFDLPVTDKAAFEKHMTVTSSPAQAGSWYWLSSREAHWRPKSYWKPGTKVNVQAQLNGVKSGKLYGEMTRTSKFTIGRSVIAKVNLKTHEMNVAINGKSVKTIPITGGQPGFTTRSGVKIITDKVTNITMRAETIGLKKGEKGYYPDTPVKWALRLTNSGEFLHSAPWSVGDQGRRNVSHGCTGMSNTNGAWVYQNFKIGDVVDTTGTDRPMTMGNGIADWNLSWAAWQKGSAL